MKRTLSLKRDALTELSPADLHAVVGAAPPSSPVASCLDNTKLVCYTNEANPSYCLCPTEA